MELRFEDWPLNEDEMLFREAYRKGPSSLWEQPMTYSAYEQYRQEGKVVVTTHSNRYRDNTLGARGVTVEEVAGPIQARLAVHSRYSYPILHNHNYVEIVYVASGQCVNLFETTSFPMKAGDVCILSPNAMHAISCTRDDTCVLNMMVNRTFFTKQFLHLLRGGKVLVDYLEGILFQRSVSPYILFPTGSDEWLQVLAGRMLAEHTRQRYGYDFSITLLIGQFLLQVVRDWERSAIVPGRSGNRQNELIVGVLSYLNVHYHEATLARTASYFGYSPAYLSRVIHEQTGKTFNAIIAQIQMEQAAKLLQQGTMSLTQIAHEVGCFDSSHFNRKFKAVFGVSPRVFLERRKTEEG